MSGDNNSLPDELNGVATRHRFTMCEIDFRTLVRGGTVQKRFDQSGRDITGLSGLWNEDDIGVEFILSDIGWAPMLNAIIEAMQRD